MKLDGLPSTVMPPPAVTFTFDLLVQKSSQQIYEPKNWVKFPLLVFEIWCSQGFGPHRLTHGPTDPSTECLHAAVEVSVADT